MTQIPKEIRYEFFYIVIGLTPIIFAIWVYLFRPDLIPKLMDFKFSSIFWTIILGASLFNFLHGVNELGSNYILLKRIKIREALIREYEFDQKIKKLPLEYRSRIFPEKKKPKK